jgi:hypothetical protein
MIPIRVFLQPLLIYGQWVCYGTHAADHQGTFKRDPRFKVTLRWGFCETSPYQKASHEIVP